MAQFPLDAAHILALADSMIAGFTANPEVFPSPPVSVAQMQAERDAAAAAHDAQLAAQAASKAATEVKTDAFSDLTGTMKNNVSYAEFTARTPADLSLIGWGPRAEPTPLAPPGQPGSLDIPRQSAGQAQLVWEKPTSGGRPAFYKAEARTVNPAGAWQLKGTSTSLKIELTDLVRNVELEFRVIAENAAGAGTPSNTVTAVL
ncbi:fibronectin type III domain-containing protein [Candidatus Electronema sp. TJ]|uniref:fibronectin type III domain-containing protein n=1 Tax=Candidatus Electronema sp. TJ TaxID=3401573 RepID=UPI003AA7E39D